MVNRASEIGYDGSKLLSRLAVVESDRVDTVIALASLVGGQLEGLGEHAGEVFVIKSLLQVGVVAILDLIVGTSIDVLGHLTPP